MKFNIITVTYGDRFKFLKQVLDATISDTNVDKVILVDNASSNKKEIDEYVAEANSKQQKIVLVRHSDNLGSAGGFKSGILEARKHICDYVLLLDDDNVPEKGWSEKIAGLTKLFTGEKVVISLNRQNAVGNNIDFSVPDLYKKNYLKLNIIGDFYNKIKSYFNKGSKKTKKTFPIVYTSVGVYGGTLLPFSAILEIDPPKDIFNYYFDDFEYMSRIEKSGYVFYIVKKPAITDVDSSFSNNTNSTKSFFDLNSNANKIYYYSRNRVLLRRIAKTQNIISLFLNSFTWVMGQVIYGFFVSKNKKHWLKISNILFKGFGDAFCVKI